MSYGRLGPMIVQIQDEVTAILADAEAVRGTTSLDMTLILRHSRASKNPTAIHCDTSLVAKCPASDERCVLTSVVADSLVEGIADDGA